MGLADIKAKYKAPEWLQGIMMRHRGLRFVSINRKMHKTSFDDKVRCQRDCLYWRRRFYAAIC
jgi:hypothetical protein